jgi:uncharacterized protein (TIGR00369 family)
MKPLPEHGCCLVCGTENPHSFGIQWFITKAGLITGKITLTDKQQGPPDFAHGGATAALVDEAMGASIWQAGYTVVAVNLNVDYIKPVPLGQEIEVSGQIAEVEEGEKIVKAEGQIRLPDGNLAVTACGIYVYTPQLFGKLLD